MKSLDDYIYDSQFLFLNKKELLCNKYKCTVLEHPSIHYIPQVNSYLKEELWDSNKFSIRIARYLWIENKVTDEVYKSLINATKAFKCVYVRVNTKHSFCENANQNGLNLLSTKVLQNINLHNKKLQFDPTLSYQIYSANSGNDNVLYQVLEISENSFNYNRFQSDPFFTKGQIVQIYREWIINEVNTNSSQLYYVMVDTKVAAFFLYKTNISPLDDLTIGLVSLIASSNIYKKKKYATNLLNYVFNKVKSKTNYVIANTEIHNTSALKFFAKNNFQITSYLNEYHIWN